MTLVFVLLKNKTNQVKIRVVNIYISTFEFQKIQYYKPIPFQAIFCISPQALIHLLGSLENNAFCVLAFGASVSWE